MTQKPQTVLVTGTSSGLGRAIAIECALRGHRVFASMRAVADRNAGAADALRAFAAPHPIEVIEIDVEDENSVNAGVAAVIASTGGVDTLVNCAGAMWTGCTEAFSPDQLKQLFETNVAGPFRMMRAALPSMRARRHGLLISVTSTCGRSIAPGMGIYSASKYALEALAETIGYEVSPFGVDSVIVEPGPFSTNLMAAMQPPADVARVAEYGEHGQLDVVLAERIVPLIAASGASTDPELVGKKVADLIAMTPGTRPVRVTVGLDVGVGRANEETRAFQSRFLAELGFSALERVQPSA